MKTCQCGKRANYLKKNRKYLCDTCAQEQGMLVPCTGEAHRNPFIDNCGVCMPRWGLIEVVPVDPKTETATLRLTLNALIEALDKADNYIVKDYLNRLPALQEARRIRNEN